MNTYSRTFDLDLRMTSYPLGNSASGGLLRTVVYDAANRITSYSHTGPAGFDQTFGYDDLDRLTSFTSSTASLGYSYDANGNRPQFRIGATPYNNTIASTSNRLSSTAGPAPIKSDSFDAAGNTTSDGAVTYVYSDRGRLKRSTKSTVPTDYLYNAIGQRMSKTGITTSTGVNFYAYDVQGHVAGEYTSGGTALEETVYLDDTPVAMLNSSGVYYVYADHINTPRVITNSTDNSIVWRWDQADPFGRDAPNENPSGVATFSYNLRFPGQVFDAESGLHYNYFRDYDPQTGRYIQSDPVGISAGINT
jgi:RHS repeat-associated protein